MNCSIIAAFILLLFTFHLESTEVKNRPVLLIVGTRPEAIKMIPVFEALKKENIPALLCSTGQHAELLDDVWMLFQVKPDYEFKIMKAGQDLFYLTEVLLNTTKELFEKLRPSMVVVQGDTTSAMVAALSAYYLKIPVAHVEAGLRTGSKYAPFPEEVNRKIISSCTQLHFTPTLLASSHLLNEGISEGAIFCVGNTVIDSLQYIREKIAQRQIGCSPFIVETIEQLHAQKKKIVVLTAHRRESFDGGLAHIFTAIKKALLKYPELFIIYPMHPNPAIKKIVDDVQFIHLPNLLITKPLAYQDMVYILGQVQAVATDSGGLQEEAVCCNQQVLVLRNVTDRPEGLQENQVEVVGYDEAKILAGIDRIMRRKSVPALSCSENLVYGDGQTSKRIAACIRNYLQHPQ